MATTPPPQRDRKLASTGGRFLLAGAVLAVIGFVMVLLLEGTANGIGVAVLSFAGIALVVGITLVGSGVVSKRSREDKPFA
jgi:hypothetical protein